MKLAISTPGLMIIKKSQKAMENYSIVNSDGLITIKLDHKFSINDPLILENFPEKALPFNIL